MRNFCSDNRVQFFGVALHERSVGKVLAKLGHPQTDEEAQEAFNKNFAATVAAQLPEHAKDKANGAHAAAQQMCKVGRAWNQRKCSSFH
jgi:organic hydroperoxide reductase OsmC/OhrA